MNSCLSRALHVRYLRLSIPVLVLAPTAASADSAAATGGGAVNYWLLAFLLAANIAGAIHMRRWTATVQGREDKE